MCTFASECMYLSECNFVFTYLFSSPIACAFKPPYQWLQWSEQQNQNHTALLFVTLPFHKKTLAGIHTYTQWETRLFHWPQQTPSATLPTRHTEFCRVLVFPIRAFFLMTLHLYSFSCIKTFKLVYS